MWEIVPLLFCYNGAACACLSGFQLLHPVPCLLPGLGIDQEYLSDRFRMPGPGFLKYVADDPRDLIESNGSIQERSHCHLIGCIQGHSFGASGLQGLISQAQTGKLLHVGRAEIQMT
jgi:hypothetical protein